jgi:hypothetical protein
LPYDFVVLTALVNTLYDPSSSSLCLSLQHFQVYPDSKLADFDVRIARSRPVYPACNFLYFVKSYHAITDFTPAFPCQVIPKFTPIKCKRSDTKQVSVHKSAHRETFPIFLTNAALFELIEFPKQFCCNEPLSAITFSSGT